MPSNPTTVFDNLLDSGPHCIQCSPHNRSQIYFSNPRLSGMDFCFRSLESLRIILSLYRHCINCIAEYMTQHSKA